MLLLIVIVCDVILSVFVFLIVIVVICSFVQSNQFNVRDLKPENCLLAHNGYLKLVDLGLAKRLKVILSI